PIATSIAFFGMSALGQKRTLRPFMARQVEMAVPRHRINWGDAGVILAVKLRETEWSGINRPHFLLRARVRFRLLAHQTNGGLAACCGHSDPSTAQPISRTLPGAASAVVPLAPYITSLRADPPNDASSRNLNQRPIVRTYEVGVCSVVSHRAVVSNPSATVGSESDVERTIERRLAFGGTRYERLVTRLVSGEIHDLEHKWLPSVGKVDELDLVTDFWRWGSRIRRREAEITLQRIE